MDCPVCPNTGIAGDAAKCPNCNVDLMPLRRVQQLRAASQRPQRALLPIIALTAIIAAALTAGADRLMRRAPANVPAGVAHASAVPISKPAPAPADPLAALVTELGAIPGITISRNDDQASVRFDEALFPAASNEFTPAALAALPSIAAALANEKVEVRVEGFTERAAPSPGTGWRDNWSLALGRAQAVANALHREGGAAVWLATAGPPAAAPYSNDTPDGRRRNRTVVLRIRGTQP